MARRRRGVDCPQRDSRLPSAHFDLPDWAQVAGWKGIWVTVKDWPAFDPSVFSLNVIGSLGWVVAVGALAFAARRAGAPPTQWILIGLAALFLMGGHPSPFGSLAFGCLFLAGLVRELHASRPTSPPAASTPSEA